MTRPEIIRADTIDLQGHDNPSAQRHVRPTPDGSLAPHQAETLREVAAEAAGENLSFVYQWNGDPDDRQQQQQQEQRPQYAIDSETSGRQQDGGIDGAGAMQAAQQDALAIAQNGGLSGHEADDGDMDGENEVDMDDDMMDKISSSPSIEDEDIDFDFVYALHTFVATVEGQANATKGDTMVLLDDSNSYWWLVRVVKDASIGYLPAEHIETPTERLARLNKHRNIDLSATMLGDQAEKTRNPLKSAMKRRKTKTVHFADPTIVKYEEFDYSSEEEDAELDALARQGQAAQQVQQAQQAQQGSADLEMEDETARVEPLKPRSQQKDSNGEPKKPGSGDTDTSLGRGGSLDTPEARGGDGPKKTSDGTVRDSFFKDDTVETKKITLTPNLLRDDNAPRTSSDSKEIKQRPSLDKLESTLSKDDKKKKDKKDKDKKPGTIRSFFSRKDKKARDDDEELSGKRSMDVDSGDREKEREAEHEEPQLSPEKPAAPQRQPSKLQKQQPRTEPSPTRKSGNSRENGMDIITFLSDGKVNNVANNPPVSMRLVDSSPKASPQGSPRGKSSMEPSPDLARDNRPRMEARPPAATKAKTRMELDEFDTESEDDAGPQTRQMAGSSTAAQQQQRSVHGGSGEAYQTGPAAVQAAKSIAATTPPQQHVERLSESPVQVSPVTVAHPPALVGDTSSQEEDHSSPRSTPSPELIEHDGADTSINKDSMTTSTSTARSSWNDASLRAFFDSGTDIRDLLVVVYDKSDTLAQAPSEHAIASSLFREQNAKLAEITTQLDNMLGDWLARKQRMRGSV